MKELIEGEINRFDRQVKYKASLINIADLTNEKVLENCKPCQNYNKNYSCPPLAPSINSLKKTYKNIFIYTFYTKGNLKEDWEKLSQLVFEYGLMAESWLDGLSVRPGSCRICSDCKAAAAEPCAYPEKLRYSFTGVGLDAQKLAEILCHEIRWGEPEYITAIGGCLTNRRQIAKYI